jgi:hypothetical protein
MAARIAARALTSSALAREIVVLVGRRAGDVTVAV